MEEAGQKNVDGDSCACCIEATEGPFSSVVCIASLTKSVVRMAGIAEDIWTVKSQEAEDDEEAFGVSSEARLRKANASRQAG